MSESKEFRTFSDCMQAFSGSTGGRKNWRERSEWCFIMIVHIHTFITQWRTSLRRRNKNNKWPSVCSLEGLLFTDIQYMNCFDLCHLSHMLQYDIEQCSNNVRCSLCYHVKYSACFHPPRTFPCFVLLLSDDIHPSVSDQRLEMKAGRSLRSYCLVQGCDHLISTTWILWPKEFTLTMFWATDNLFSGPLLSCWRESRCRLLWRDFVWKS